MPMTEGANFLKRPILGGEVNFPLSLAPMVGLTHVALRRMVQRYLPEGAVTIWPTEMLSSWRIPREELGQTAETLKHKGETHLVPQILGNEEKPIAESVRKLAAWGARGIDVNMGCPVNKALKHNYGVALMGDADYAAEVVRMTKRNSPVPVSVKLRAGLQNDEAFLLKFTRGLEEAGADWMTLHPRVGAMKRRGAADWRQIRLVRDHVQIPVIGNGDVQCLEDVFAMNEISGCDAVMAGRALAARPWLFWQLGERLGFPPPKGFSGRAPAAPEEEGAEFGRACVHFVDLLEEYFVFEEGHKRLKFYLRMTGGWLEFGHHLFAVSSKAKNYGEVREAVIRFFEGPQAMSLRTHLRE
jgi:tRNA-dihydrouridine synthase B